MENKDRKIRFTLNAAAILLIIVIVYLNYQWMIFFIKTLKTYNGIYYGREPLYALQVAYFISIFLSSLLLQGEEIYAIIRRRNSLLIRWELIILGIIAFLLALIKIWLPLLFPEHNYGVFSRFVYSILTNYLWDIIFMFAAGIFVFRAFHVRDSFIEKKDRIVGFTLNIAAIILAMVIVYWNYELKWYLIETSDIKKSLETYSPLSDYYLRYFVNLISAFVCSLLLLGEYIYTIIRQRKSILIRREQLILGLVAIILAPLYVWFRLIHYNLCLPAGFDIFPAKIIEIISLYDFWDNTFMFAAGMLFVRAFHIKIDPFDLGRNNPSEIG